MAANPVPSTASGAAPPKPEKSKTGAVFVCLAVSCAVVAMCALVLFDVVKIGKRGSKIGHLKETEDSPSPVTTMASTRAVTRAVQRTKATAATRHTLVRRKPRTTKKSFAKKKDIGGDSSTSTSSSSAHNRTSTIPADVTKGSSEGKKTSTSFSTPSSGVSDNHLNVSESGGAGEGWSVSHAVTEAGTRLATGEISTTADNAVSGSSDTDRKVPARKITGLRLNASIAVTVAGTHQVRGDIIASHGTTESGSNDTEKNASGIKVTGLRTNDSIAVTEAGTHHDRGDIMSSKENTESDSSDTEKNASGSKFTGLRSNDTIAVTAAGTHHVKGDVMSPQGSTESGSRDTDKNAPGSKVTGLRANESIAVTAAGTHHVRGDVMSPGETTESGSSDNNKNAAGSKVTGLRNNDSIAVTAADTHHGTGNIMTPQETIARGVAGTNTNEYNSKVAGPDANATILVTAAGTHKETRRVGNPAVTEDGSDHSSVQNEPPVEEERGLVSPATTGVGEKIVSRGYSETPVYEIIKKAFADEPWREGRSGGDVGSSYRLLCTAGARATYEEMLPPDGLCDLLFYTDVVWRDGAVHGSGDDRSWSAFQKGAREATKTGHGLSLDYGKSNDFYGSLTTPLGRQILRELFESKIIHYGILKATGRVAELLDDMHGKLGVLKALKDLQAKFIREAPGIRAEGDVALGIKFLSYNNSVDSSQHSSAMTVLTKHLPITIFIVHTHIQDWEAGKYPIIGTMWHYWNDLVDSNEPSLRRTARELNATTIPLRTYVMASFTLMVGEFELHQALENKTLSSSYMSIKDFTELCSRRSGLSVVNGGLVKLRAADRNRTYAYEDAETMSAKATAFFKLYQHPRRGWAVFDTEYEDYDNSCGTGSFSRLKAFKAQLTALS